MSKKPLAIFTMVRNEPVFLPLWLRHYGRTHADLFVLDHQTDDGSTSWPDVRRQATVLPVTNPTTDDADWMLRTVEAEQRRLLGEYEIVVYAEADEFLVPDPNHYASLGEFIARRRAALPLTASGFETCDAPDAPPLASPFDAWWQHPVVREPAQTPLAGRRWLRNDRYDKTLISSSPLSWEVGFHRLRDVPMFPDPGLFLLHFHYADREYGWRRIEERMRRMPPAPGDLGFQNKYRNRADYDRNFDRATGGASLVPDWLVGAV